MKIAVVSPFEEKVPPARYGGTELVIYNLVEQLVKKGHEVILLATGNSETSAKLVPIFKRSLREIPELNDMKIRDAYKFMGVGKVISYLANKQFDIVHNHIGWRVLPFEEVLNCPIITTLHGPLDIDYQQKVYQEHKNSNYVSISMSQRRPLPDLNFIANVYNGIEVEKFKFFPAAKDYFAFLGRMSPEKGPVEAIQIAKKAGVKLIMAAKVDLVDEEFFQKEVEPLINGKQIKFIGEVDHEEKVKLLGNAKALIAPIQWEEPFGLYFIEAMICGTPVITLRKGSAPEIVFHRKTGYICDNLDEAAEKIKYINEINRRDCFEHAKQNFSSEKMADNYISAYKKILKIE